MQLETQALEVLVSSYCCSSYRVVDAFSSLGVSSSFSIGGPVFHPIAECEHPLLCLPGTGRASQETAISGSCQQNLAGICNSICVWWLIMWWIPRWGSLWMVHPFVSALNFVSVTPPSRPSLRREAPWSWKLYMPQYRGMQGPRSGSGWVGEQGSGEGIGNFWDNIWNVNKEISNKN